MQHSRCSCDVISRSYSFLLAAKPADSTPSTAYLHTHTNTHIQRQKQAHTQRQAIYSTHNFISLAPSLGNFSLTVRNTRTREQIDFPPCRAVFHCLHRYFPFSFFLFLSTCVFYFFMLLFKVKFNLCSRDFQPQRQM